MAISTAAWLTALAATVKRVGNLAAGRLLERGVPPVTLRCTGFVCVGTGAIVAFGLPAAPWLQ